MIGFHLIWKRGKIKDVLFNIIPSLILWLSMILWETVILNIFMWWKHNDMSVSLWIFIIAGKRFNICMTKLNFSLLVFPWNRFFHYIASTSLNRPFLFHFRIFSHLHSILKLWFWLQFRFLFVPLQDRWLRQCLSAVKWIWEW